MNDDVNYWSAVTALPTEIPGRNVDSVSNVEGPEGIPPPCHGCDWEV